VFGEGVRASRGDRRQGLLLQGFCHVILVRSGE
jgi:hypothetical protein